jgi:hypothetical protein
MTAESYSRRSVEIPAGGRNSVDHPESPRRSSGPEGEKSSADGGVGGVNAVAYEDSELSLELGKLQREVDELVYGLTKKRGGSRHVAGLGGSSSASSK